MDKMLSNKYYLLFKTGDAELRALDNLLCGNDNIFPIIELTRGRRSKIDKIGEVQKRLNRLETIFRDKEVCLDLTVSSQLDNKKIRELFNPNGGYAAWLNFLIEQIRNNIFNKIVPTLLVDTTDKELNKNLKLQTTKLCENFSSIAYRNDIADDGCYEDIDAIKDIINHNARTFYFILDCQYIAPGAWISFAEKAAIRVQRIADKIENLQLIIVSTSFPKYVSDIGQDDTDTFRLNEIDLFDEVQRNTNLHNLHYGDYGTINPVRNDLVTMSRGWIPRIDVPLQQEVYYHRKRRGKSRGYSETYIDVAKNYIVPDERFPSQLLNNWGVNQIKLCADDKSPGSSPSFWISVRMNIHIEQQLNRLRLLK